MTEKKATDRMKTIGAESAGLFSDFIREFPVRVTLIVSWFFTKVHSVKVKYVRWVCWLALVALALLFWPVTVALGILFILAHVLGDVDSRLSGPPVDIGTEKPKKEKKEKPKVIHSLADLPSILRGKNRKE